MKIARLILFNWWTMLWISGKMWKVKSIFHFMIPPDRAKIMMMDLWYITAVFTPFFVLGIVIHELLTIEYFLGFLPQFVLINKDLVNGRSVAKRASGYQLIDRKSKKIASPFQCMIRNLTYIIWPIEVVAILLNKRRRLGDLIANTELAQYPISEPTEILDELKSLSFNLEIALTLLISALFVYFIANYYIFWSSTFLY